MVLFVSAVLVVLVVSFLCSVFESVLLSLTRPQIELMTQQGKRAGHLLAGFKANMDVPIAAILILNTAAHTVGAAVAGASYSAVFDPSTLWLFSLLFTLAVLLFTEIIPKTLGVTYAQALATPVAHGIRWLSISLGPLVWLSERLSRSLRGHGETPVTSSEEIRLLALLGKSEGAVSGTTAGLIVGATQLKDLAAEAVMLPRESVRYLRGGMSRDEALATLQATGHSRFPFTPTGDLNEADRVVLAKSLLHWLLTQDDEAIDWEAVSHPALVVPNTTTLPQLLQTFQSEHRHLALIVDEYGTVEGIATLEDILEEVVGEINDEKDAPAEDFRTLPDGTLLVRATVDLRRLSTHLGLAWDRASEAASIGGLLVEQLERIPVTGDAIEWQGYQLKVLRADRRRARVVAVTPVSSDTEQG